MDDDKLKQCFESLLCSLHDDLKSKKREDLEEYWHFTYDKEKPFIHNLYEFNECMDIYRDFCEKWEEIHNGCVCICERVRDNYIIPKCIEFEEKMRGVE